MTLAASNVVIRQMNDGDAEARAFVTGYAFAGDRGPKAVEEFARSYPIEWARGLFQDGALIASLLVLPYTLLFEGARIQFGGIADVACPPEYRRRGHVGGPLRTVLAELRDRGTPLSGLYTPHVPLYRRFGWEVATHNLRLRFPTKRATLLRAPPPAGRPERIDADQWQRADRIYNAWFGPRNGGLSRSAQRWREQLFGLSHRSRDAVVWLDEHGADQGYAFYRETGWVDDRRGDLLVREVIALDGEAYRGLTAYLLSHDLTKDVVWDAGLDEPVFALLDDPGIVSVERNYGQLLRIVDLPAAMAARPCYAAAETAVTIALHDDTCPWNDGTWRLAGRDGALVAERSQQQAELELAAGTLAALYNGGASPFTAQTAGLLTSSHPDAVERLRALLMTRFQPDCAEFF